MKTALLLTLLVVAGAAFVEGHTRKALQAPRGATPPKTTPPKTATGSATAPRTAGAVTATTTTAVIQTPSGPVKVGTVATARPRLTKNNAAKAGTAAAKTQNAQEETCRSVGPREYCGNTEQANCCEYWNMAQDVWKGCAVASNLYTCVAQFDDKPVAVCCS